MCSTPEVIFFFTNLVAALFVYTYRSTTVTSDSGFDGKDKSAGTAPNMVFYLIGLGLYDERDITLRHAHFTGGGLEAVKRCSRVYLEAYTSILLCEKSKLEALYGKEVIVADREMVEMGADDILKGADTEDVALLVVGDPFGATTHTDIQLRAREKGIPVRVIHNASVMNAVGAAGLQLYRFGECISIVFFTETWRPDSFYDKIAINRAAGLHTLCLLDIKVKEPNLAQLARGRTVYEPPRYMTINTALEQLLEVEARRKEGAYSPETLCIGISRLQSDDQMIVAGSMQELVDVDFGRPLHSLLLAGNPDIVELEMVEFYRLNSSHPRLPVKGGDGEEGGETSDNDGPDGGLGLM